MENKSKGFTLVELMVTVLIAAVLLAVAIPSFDSAIANNRSNSLGEEFSGALSFIRLEALKRRELVSLCASRDGINCAGANDWREGFIAFVDFAAETDPAPLLVDPTNNRIILKVWGPQNPAAQINITRNGVATEFVRYTGAGILARVNNVPLPVNARLRINGCTGTYGRDLVIGIAGVINIRQANC